MDPKIQPDSCETCLKSPQTEHICSLQTNSMLFECRECRRCFRTQDEFLNHNHEINYTNKIYKCDLCSEGFVSAEKLNRHVLEIHNRLQIFPCKAYKCGKYFSSDILLVNHIRRLHTGEKPFICYPCRISFYMPHEYANHIRNAHRVRLF